MSGEVWGAFLGGLMAAGISLITLALSNHHQARLHARELRQQTVVALVSLEFERLRAIEADMVVAAHAIDAKNVDGQLVKEGMSRLSSNIAYVHRYPSLHAHLSTFLDALTGAMKRGKDEGGRIAATDNDRQSVQDAYNGFRVELGRLVDTGEILNPRGETNLFGFRRRLP